MDLKENISWLRTNVMTETTAQKNLNVLKVSFRLAHILADISDGRSCATAHHHQGVMEVLNINEANGLRESLHILDELV